MQILFFILAAIATGGTCAFNLGAGFAGPANWISLGLSALTVLLWCLWIYLVMAKAANSRRFAIALSLIFVFCIVGLVLYANWEKFPKILGGISLSFGALFALPLVGFAKLFGKIKLSRYLFILPYILFIGVTWLLCYAVSHRPAQGKASKKEGAAESLEKPEKLEKLEKQEEGDKEQEKQEENSPSGFAQGDIDEAELQLLDLEEKNPKFEKFRDEAEMISFETPDIIERLNEEEETIIEEDEESKEDDDNGIDEIKFID